MKQTTFASLAWSNKGKVTRRERFLAEMDTVIPWARVLALITPHYPSDALGRPRKDMELMLRVYFLQQWFNLSDPRMADSLYDSESMRRFAGVELGETATPDESTILRFRHLLEAHQLTRIRARVEHPFNVVKRLWGFTKVRYHGIGKNLAKAYTMFALANLYLVRRRLMPPGAKCAL